MLQNPSDENALRPRSVLAAGLLLVSLVGAAAPSVAREQAPRGALDATPLHYQLTVTPDFGTRTFDGILVIDLRIDKVCTRITLDAVDLEVYDAEILLPHDRRIAPTISTDAAAGTVSFSTPTRLSTGTVKLRISYSGRLREDGRGFYLARSHGRKYLLSQMEATDARRAFPCVDDPAFKASFAVSAVIDTRLTAISNGRLVSDTPSEKYGKHVLRFGTTPRMSTYLVALAVGEFGCVEASAESVPIRVCAVPENVHRTAFALEAARRAFAFHAQYFTFKYPFRKLDLIAVPGGFPGAMENSGAIFFDEGLLVDPAEPPDSAAAESAAIISHEIAHQWLGDVVTMRWWDDLWLNEGLATWIEWKPVAAWKPAWRADLAAAVGVRRAMAADVLPSARAVRSALTTEAEIEEAFDEMAYDKAAAILRMVEAWVGPDVFRNALNAFVREHAYGSAVAEDLWKALTLAADKPVDLVMRAFLTQPGLPVVSLAASCAGDETVLDASVTRLGATAASVAARAEQPAPVAPIPPPAPWPIPLEARGVNPIAPMLVHSTRLLTESPQRLRLGGCFPGVFVNGGATGYFVTAYEPAALAALAPVAGSRLTPAERIRLLDDQWVLARAGRAPIGNFLAAASALAGDPTPEVIETIGDRLADLADHVVGDSARAAFGAWIAKTMGPTAGTLGWQPAPGETVELGRLRAAVFSLLGIAGRDDGVLAKARGLWTADVTGGQPIDRSLQAVVTRVVARTAAPGELQAMLVRDPETALSAAGDPSFVVATLGRALVDESRREALPQWIAAGLRNPRAAADVWAFLKSRWTELQPALGAPLALADVVRAAGSLCDATSRDEVERFFADKGTTVARTLRRSLDQIDACRDFRLKQEGPLADWLRQTAPAFPTRPDIR